MFKRILNIIKGWIGEAGISFAQKLYLNNEIYHPLNNVTIESTNGTTQIDHIVVSVYGIFVTETKSYSGWIFGDEKSSVWTQVLFGKKNTFQNPLRQNYRHIKVLQDFLGLEERCFHSIVLFAGESKFKTKMPENVMSRGYSSYIKGKKDIIFSGEEVDNIVKALQAGKLPKTFITNIAHVQSLKDRHGSLEICPKCGGRLVERTARTGQNAGNKFLGCSSFPKCRFVKNI